MADPKPQFSHFANKLLPMARPDLAYLHVIEPDEPSVEESYVDYPFYDKESA